VLGFVVTVLRMKSICDDLQAESDDLFAMLGHLDADQWDVLTPADPWTVRDSVSHLAYFDGTATLAATDEDAFKASAKVLLSSKVDDVGIPEGRAMSALEVLQWLTDSRAAMISVFRTLDPKARLPWYGPAMAATSFATARLMETWAHGQDIADTFAIVRTPTDRLKHVAHIGVRARAFAYAINGQTMPDNAVRVVLTAPSGAQWSWNDESGDANVVRGDALDFCLAVTQRRHVADTSLQVVGPLAQEWMGIAQAFAGPPGGGRQPGQFTSN
jgi:uncharacterized protein (TIGR03084 family)